MLNYLYISKFKTNSGIIYKNLPLSYQVFGRKLDSKTPIILVNHALTGNSNVAGKTGWWKNVINETSPLNLNHFTFICFNIPFNHPSNQYIFNYKDFTADDIAKLFLNGLQLLNINNIDIGIGGSLGGGILWHMTAHSPSLFKQIITIACTWKSSNWIYAITSLQEELLLTHNNVDAARKSAMLFYRNKENFDQKFNSHSSTKQWLQHHAKRLSERFSVSSYLLVNRLLQTVDIFENPALYTSLKNNYKGNVTNIYINSDMMFKAQEIKDISNQLNSNTQSKTFKISSNLGHDGFLVENNQLNNILSQVIINTEVTL